MVNTTLAVLVLLACIVWAGFPATIVFQRALEPQPLSVASAVIAFASALALGLPLAAVLARRIDACGAMIDRLPTFWVALVAGLLLRLLAAAVASPVPTSDGAMYMQLAQALLAGESYRAGDTWAYWPPGMAFALLPFLALPFPSALSLTLFAVVWFVVAAFGVRALARACGLAEGPQRLAVWALCAWPSHILCTGVPEKELVVVALVPWILALAVRAFDAGPRPAVLAGVLSGAAVLIQPSLQLLPLAGAFAAILAGVAWRPVASTLLVGLCAAAAVVGPWTIRNQLVLGAPVLVSTNGGGNLYRANNELATGGYVARGAIDLSSLPELEADRQGKRLAAEWMRDNPRAFLRLAATKVLLFAGDDSHGVFAAWRGQRDAIDRSLYLGLRLAATSYWLVLWTLIAAASLALVRRSQVPWRTVWLLTLPYAYLSLIHAIFESGGKYHLPAVLPLFVLAAMLLSDVARTKALSP